MGTKGRDLAIYGYFGGFLLFLLTKFLKAGESITIFPLLIMSLSLGSIIVYHAVYLPWVKKKSREEGFKSLVLLPLFPWWANFLLWLAGKKIRARDKALEIHLEVHEKINLSELLKLMNEDIELLFEKYPEALVMWETHVPLPQVVRKIIKTEEAKGNAFWEKGSWPILKPPFTYLRLDRKRARYGAGIIPKS